MKLFLALVAIVFWPISTSAQAVDSEDGGVEILMERMHNTRTYTAHNSRSDVVCVVMSVIPDSQQNVSFHFDSLKLRPGESAHIGQVWPTDSRAYHSFNYRFFWHREGTELCR